MGGNSRFRFSYDSFLLKKFFKKTYFFFDKKKFVSELFALKDCV